MKYRKALSKQIKNTRLAWEKVWFNCYCMDVKNFGIMQWYSEIRREASYILNNEDTGNMSDSELQEFASRLIVFCQILSNLDFVIIENRATEEQNEAMLSEAEELGTMI